MKNFFLTSLLLDKSDVMAQGTTMNQGGGLPENPRIIYMGTPEFAVPALQALLREGYDIAAVVTQPDRPRGRGRKMTASPVKQVAVKHRIPILQPEGVSSGDFQEAIKDKAPDLIIVVAFGQKLTKDLLALPEYGVINIHASLLPKYRGAAPIQRAILNNESLTGLTIMRMEEGLDTGPILYQEEVPVLKDETAGQLHDRLASVAGDVLIRFLMKYKRNRIQEQTQDDSSATYAKKITKEMSLIQWEQDAARISGLIRALDPWPGARTMLGPKELKLFKSRVINEARSDGIPGRVMGEKDKRFRVETGRGVIEIGEVQFPGKKRLPAGDFLRGFSLPDGTVLGK